MGLCRERIISVPACITIRLQVRLWNNQQDALCRLIYYSKSDLHVLGDVFARHQEHLTVFTVSDSVHLSCCRLVLGTPSSSNLGEHYQILWIQSSAPDNAREHRPKNVEPIWNNKLIYVVHLVGHFHNCITVHGFMNVKPYIYLIFLWMYNFVCYKKCAEAGEQGRKRER